MTGKRIRKDGETEPQPIHPNSSWAVGHHAERNEVHVYGPWSTGYAVLGLDRARLLAKALLAHAAEVEEAARLRRER